MNTASGRIEKIPKEYQHGLLFAVTQENKCVGVRLFSNNGQSNENSNIRLDNYIDQSVKRAIELKSSVEDGRCDFERNREIVLSTSTKFTDTESLIRSRTKGIQHTLIEVENRFIGLGKIIIRSVQTGKCELLKCEICLGEMYLLSEKMLTPLMLKKNPEIVRGVSKLCRYTVTDKRRPGQSRTECSKIRSYANKTFGGFKTVMGYKNEEGSKNVTNEEFFQCFNDSVKLFHELTACISDDERRRLTDDPESSLAVRIIA
ncbi:uncharacterized protein LOC129572303 [Sitodiplosis mosellana]|uniref:uncharacterized protein LOC129572303 n=1 Tax=Sitodiplosis mosellana TaxID=263140 RepID=UPI0024452F45|nr:uncharacterized protein LOC129572303 [Sitodiplosis mosellana]